MIAVQIVPLIIGIIVLGWPLILMACLAIMHVLHPNGEWSITGRKR